MIYLPEGFEREHTFDKAKATLLALVGLEWLPPELKADIEAIQKPEDFVPLIKKIPPPQVFYACTIIAASYMIEGVARLYLDDPETLAILNKIHNHIVSNKTKVHRSVQKRDEVEEAIRQL